jgi:hypothetical protein
MMSPRVIASDVAGVRVLTLNRPEARPRRTSSGRTWRYSMSGGRR